MNAAVQKLHADLAFAKASDHPDAEAVVITTQATVREVLTEIERLNDRIQSPQSYTIPAPKLTKKQRREAMTNSPVPVIPWVDYGNPRRA